jgi:drug/metabolite transporter superfamily protein YnfA
VREALVVWTFLVLAALLEVGGDAAVRLGLRGYPWGFWIGAPALVGYGLLVNLARWEFGRVLGVYIAVFFLVSQIVSVILFRERLQPPVLVGGALILLGGLVLTFWRGTWE